MGRLGTRLGDIEVRKQPTVAIRSDYDEGEWTAVLS